MIVKRHIHDGEMTSYGEAVVCRWTLTKNLRGCTGLITLTTRRSDESQHSFVAHHTLLRMPPRHQHTSFARRAIDRVRRILLLNVVAMLMLHNDLPRKLC